MTRAVICSHRWDGDSSVLVRLLSATRLTLSRSYAGRSGGACVDRLSTESDMLIIRQEMIQSMRHSVVHFHIAKYTTCHRLRELLVSDEREETTKGKKNEITTCENHVTEDFK